MANRGPRKAVIVITLFFLLLSLQAFIAFLYNDAFTAFESNGYPSDTSLNVTAAVKPHSPDDTADNESLRYIPHSTIQTWRERDYLIVFGILSIDIEARRRHRYLQRTTCWQFPGVARRANNFTGAMLVLYVLARHPSHGYNFSAVLLEEADEWHDVITFHKNEGRSTTEKTVTGVGYWGTEAEIGMSRKVYFWFELALRVFPNVNYISKGDDDMFLRVPQFLADLRTLPRRRVYWGVPIGWKARKGSKNVGFRFAGGMCYTLSKDVAQQFVSYNPIQRLVNLPYSNEREPEFFSFSMHREDVFVGHILYLELNGRKCDFFAESPCRFHNFYNKEGVSAVTSSSVVIHKLPEADYIKLMKQFSVNNTYLPKVKVLRGRGYVRISC
ncbi:UDP-Gal or UDP-GlcNAc-dependent glycosyltransferase [Trypanosoma theileri]|uniref:Hexosyltransferase n=1 Tax=Trypanosoma theileri TaxID=67003 RepID=A0A1X0NPX2_9TRYP|nr:UDP-Gal or UDP-GlcNAc-dependent glycosyltransferase [Trypanosoma theileri]ORC86755.1 UDP-Gal or UDP-GlcNAc-dependent glycosyltransferase [Trypanosoma theileri]